MDDDDLVVLNLPLAKMRRDMLAEAPGETATVQDKIGLQVTVSAVALVDVVDTDSFKRWWTCIRSVGDTLDALDTEDLEESRDEDQDEEEGSGAATWIRGVRECFMDCAQVTPDHDRRETRRRIATMFAPMSDIMRKYD